jgi:hypothetical protein
VECRELATTIWPRELKLELKRGERHRVTAGKAEERMTDELLVQFLKKARRL